MPYVLKEIGSSPTSLGFALNKYEYNKFFNVYTPYTSTVLYTYTMYSMVWSGNLKTPIYLIFRKTNKRRLLGQGRCRKLAFH